MLAPKAGAAKGWEKAGAGKGWEKGGEKGGKANPIKDIDPSLKVWIGKLPAGIEWKELQTHFEQAGKVKWTEVMRNGTACVAYKSAEDVQTAIGMLNGSELGGQTIEVDVWAGTGKGASKGAAVGKGPAPITIGWGPPAGGKAAAAAPAKGWGKVQTPAFIKQADNVWASPAGTWASPAAGGEGKGKGKGGGKKGGAPLKRIDPSLKVWVGGLPESTQWKDLEAHFQAAGKTTWVEVMRKGAACVAYASTEEVEVAIATLNGTEFGGQVIEVDSWTVGGGKGSKAAEGKA